MLQSFPARVEDSYLFGLPTVRQHLLVDTYESRICLFYEDSEWVNHNVDR